MIPYGKQDITDEDIDAVVAVLKSDFLTQGPRVPEFESTVARYCGASHAVAVNSATSALHIACLALGVGPGDLVWTSPVTFVASANCALYCGAAVDFVDIDSRTYNLCPLQLERKLKFARANGKRLPKVVIPVHLCGQPCDMRAIKALADEYGFSIIEDASHAIGGRCYDSVIGSCEYSDITVFSFHPVKIITTGEGGVATTCSPALAESMILYRSHGITRDPGTMTRKPEGPWYYEQITLGFNYRMTELQAALGTSQMRRLDDFVARRHRLSQRYDEKLEGLPVITPYQAAYSYSGMHLYVIQISERANKTHLDVFNDLRTLGIGVNLHYIPVHLQPYYRAKGFKLGDFPVAEQYYGRAVSLPMYHTMTDALQDQVVAAVMEAVS